MRTLNDLIIDIEKWSECIETNPQREYLNIVKETGLALKALEDQDEEEFVEAIGWASIAVIIYFKFCGMFLRDDHLSNPLSIPRENDMDTISLLMDDVFNSDENALLRLNEFSKRHGHTVQECLTVALNEINERLNPASQKINNKSNFITKLLRTFVYAK